MCAHVHTHMHTCIQNAFIFTNDTERTFVRREFLLLNEFHTSWHFSKLKLHHKENINLFSILVLKSVGCLVFLNWAHIKPQKQDEVGGLLKSTGQKIHLGSVSRLLMTPTNRKRVESARGDYAFKSKIHTHIWLVWYFFGSCAKKSHCVVSKCQFSITV